MTALERSLETSEPRPTLARRILFRFAFVYWGLYCIVIVLGTNTLDGTTPINNAIGRFAVWIGKAVLQISYDFRGDENGSGDKTSDWILILCIACIASTATVVWSLVDRRRIDTPRLREALRIVVRYSLAFTVLGYGLSKVFLGQFSQPSLGRLVQRFGDASPMGLLWTFMGASPAYVFFSGAMETIGAGLLLFRRTTTLGALVLAGVMLNVAMLNLCYDVPVKLCSLHYFAMAIFLLLPDARRLLDVTVFHRAVQPVARDLVLPRRWMRITRIAVKYAAIATVLFLHLRSSLKHDGIDKDTRPKPWYDGYWSVASFTRNRVNVPDSTAEPNRWTRIRFQVGDHFYARWRLTGSGLGDLYDAAIDEGARVITLTFDPKLNGAKQPPPGFDVIRLTYDRPGENRLDLEAQLGADRIAVQLERMEPEKMLLVTRGFHWISEAPFNR